MTMPLNRIEFHGHQIEATEEDGRIWVVLKRVCCNLGIAFQSQHRKVKENPVFEGRCNDMMIPSNGGQQKTLCLDLDAFTLWLGSISAARVKESVREALILYQRECMQVLRDHFFGNITDAPTAIEQIDNRLIRVECTVDAMTYERRVATEELHSMPEPLALPKPRTKRSLVNERVKRAALLYNQSFSICWNKLYLEFLFREGTDLKARARNQGKKPLDIAEDIGVMSALYDLACYLWPFDSDPISEAAPSPKPKPKPKPKAKPKTPKPKPKPTTKAIVKVKPEPLPELSAFDAMMLDQIAKVVPIRVLPLSQALGIDMPMTQQIVDRLIERKRVFMTGLKNGSVALVGYEMVTRGQLFYPHRKRSL